MSVIWNRLYAAIYIVIILAVQIRTPMSRVSISMFRICPSVDVPFYPSQNYVFCLDFRTNNDYLSVQR
jgi:hypothetical protein